MSYVLRLLPCLSSLSYVLCVTSFALSVAFALCLVRCMSRLVSRLRLVSAALSFLPRLSPLLCVLYIAFLILSFAVFFVGFVFLLGCSRSARFFHVHCKS